MAGYCTQAQIESILSSHGVSAFTDDDLDGLPDTDMVQNAIDRSAALKIDPYICERYNLSSITSNAWVQWANAVLAAVALTTRRNMPTVESLAAQEQMVLEQIRMIHAGQMKIPRQAERFDHLPAVSNFDVERFRTTFPVRVQREESTGAAPTPPIQQWTARNQVPGME